MILPIWLHFHTSERAGACSTSNHCIHPSHRADQFDAGLLWLSACCSGLRWLSACSCCSGLLWRASASSWPSPEKTKKEKTKKEVPGNVRGERLRERGESVEGGSCRGRIFRSDSSHAVYAICVAYRVGAVSEPALIRATLALKRNGHLAVHGGL